MILPFCVSPIRNFDVDAILHSEKYTLNYVRSASDKKPASGKPISMYKLAMYVAVCIRFEEPDRTHPAPMIGRESVRHDLSDRSVCHVCVLRSTYESRRGQ